MSKLLQPADLGFFSALVAAGNLSAAARELGVTTPAVSKRLAQMEVRLGVSLLNRTTRRMSLSPEGELVLERARSILTEIDELEQQIGAGKLVPKGLLRVAASLGFGRCTIAPVVSEFVRCYPGVDVQLQLSVNSLLLADDTYDVCIWFGKPPDARVVARKIAPNRRLLCASPAYLARHGVPTEPRDLLQHNCIGIRQGDDAAGVWRLSQGRGRHRCTEVVKVHGNLATNDGEIAVNWALAGHGIVMRAEWDVERYFQSGRLVQVLSQFETPEADIYAVYPSRHQKSVRVRTFVDFAAQALGGRRVTE
ncbi:MAG: LysR family transcriptional regulator [Hylemonella sp.]|nr:LysR family transcriptional regulator [Hylemonella sp.]